MEAFIHQVTSGLATGGIYASMALALVMIYQSTHHINFAQGEMAMFSTYLAWTLVEAGMPYWIAFARRSRSRSSAGVVIERIIVRPVEHAPVLSVVIVFIALLVILNSVAGWVYSYTIKSFPSPFTWTGLEESVLSPHEIGTDRRDARRARRAVRSSSASRRWASRCGPPRRTRCRAALVGIRVVVDARARLGPRRRHRRDRRDDDRAGRLPRSEHDGRRDALRVRRRRCSAASTTRSAP
jgi:hypothetical protein